MEYIDAAKAANGSFKMGGTGSKQEDQIVRSRLRSRPAQSSPTFRIRRRRGGGPTGRQSRRFHRQQPIEAVAQWRAGKLRPLCVFDNKQLDYKDKIAGDLAWDSIPTCKSAGIDVEYLIAARLLHGAGVTLSR